MQDILINCSQRETRVAVMRKDLTEDILVERKVSRGLVGNVYLGRVVRVLPGMQSAFVDIGLDRTGFLHVLDIVEARQSDGSVKPIEKILGEGRTVLVQVAKDPIGTKGARLTTAISIAGHRLVFMPMDEHIGVSQRIEDESVREMLRSKVENLARSRGDHCGYIVRTSCEQRSDEDEFLRDMDYLHRIWKRVEEKRKTFPVPSVVYKELSVSERMLRDKACMETRSIVVDSTEEYQHLVEFSRKYVPEAEAKLRLYEGEQPLFELFGIEQEIERSLARRVDLKSGGYLVIDQTEAMTTIDVNTGGFVGKRDFSETVYKTNLEAAQTIARQLRLRNLGGIIIIDFIDMNEAEHRDSVLAELHRACEPDRTKITISDFTELGLVEMTRKRTRESLSHALCEPCPLCGGRGHVKSTSTMCYAIMREISRECRLYQEAKGFKILAGQSVIDAFLETESAALDLLQDALQKPIALEVEPSYCQEQYDVLIL